MAEDVRRTALRRNEGKPELSWILHFPKAIEAMARVMEYGGKKYAPGNWKLGGKPDQEYLDATIRHLVAWQNDGPFDAESQCNHLGHVLFNIMALIDLNHPDEACSTTQTESKPSAS